jgi:hypothetical protein
MNLKAFSTLAFIADAQIRTIDPGPMGKWGHQMDIGHSETFAHDLAREEHGEDFTPEQLQTAFEVVTETSMIIAVRSDLKIIGAWWGDTAWFLQSTSVTADIACEMLSQVAN